MTELPDLDGPVSLDEAETIMAELARLREEPLPGYPGSAGCVVAMVSLIAIVLMPFVGRGFDLSSNAMLAIGVTLGLVTIVSGAIGIFGDALRERPDPRVADAVERIVAEFGNGDPERLLTATVELLERAWVSRGPSTVLALRPDDVASRLGKAIAYVERIERVLVERQKIYPVFTAPQNEERRPGGEAPPAP